IAGVYTTCSPSEVQYIVHHAESPVMLVENQKQYVKVDSQRARLPYLKHIIGMAGAALGPGAMNWDEFLAAGKGVSDDELMNRVRALEPAGLAALIYTSGTTGPPK